MQSLVDNINKVTKDVRSGYHLTLGQLVSFLENINGSRIVEFDHGLSPISPHSYRGHYSDLALESHDKPTTAVHLLRSVKRIVGRELEGYKGGEFLMTNDTPLWNSEYGSNSSVAIIGISVIGEKAILSTKYINY